MKTPVDDHRRDERALRPYRVIVFRVAALSRREKGRWRPLLGMFHETVRPCSIGRDRPFLILVGDSLSV